MISSCVYISLCLLVLNSIIASASFETAKLRSRFVRQVDDEGDGRIDQCVEESVPQIMEELPDSKAAESLRIRVAAKGTPEPDPVTASSSTPGTVKILGPEVGFFRSVTHHLHEIAEKEHNAAKEREADKLATKGGKKKDPKVGTPKSVEKVSFKPTLLIKTKKPEPKLKSKEPKTSLRINIKRNKDRIGKTNKILSIKQSRVPDSLSSSSRLGKPFLPNRKSNEIRRPIIESIGPSPFIARPPPGFVDNYNGNKKSKFASPRLNTVQELESGDIQDSMVSATHHNEKVMKVPPDSVEKNLDNYAKKKLSGEEHVINKIEPSYDPELRETEDEQDSDNITACSNLNPDAIVTQNLEDVSVHDKAAKENSAYFKKPENNDLATNNEEALKKVLENTSKSSLSDSTPVFEDNDKPILRESIGLESTYSPSKGDKKEKDSVEASNPIESDIISTESENTNSNLSIIKTDERNSLSKIIKDDNGLKKSAFGKKPVTLDEIRKLIDLKKSVNRPKLQAVENKPETVPEENIQLASIDKPCKVPQIKAIDPIKAIDSHNMLSESIHEDTDLPNANIGESNALTKITKDYNRLRNIQTARTPVSLADIRKLINSKRIDHKQKLLATKREPNNLPIDNLKLLSQVTSCDEPEVNKSIERIVSDNIPLESVNNPTNFSEDNNVDSADRKISSKITKDYGELSESTVTKTPLSLNRLRKILKFKHLHLEPQLQATERESVSKPKYNTKFNSQYMPCELSQVAATELTENKVSDNILSESMNYETNLPNNVIDISGRNLLPKTRKYYGGLPKSTIGKKIIFPPEIRKIIRSKTAKIIFQSTTVAPGSVARDDIEQKSQNTGEVLSSSLSDRPSNSVHDDLILSNPNIPTAGAKISSKDTKDYSDLLKIPLVKKSLSLAKLKNATKQKKLASISEVNLQNEATEFDTKKISTKEGSPKNRNSNEKGKEEYKLGDPPITALDGDVAASNVEARSEAHIPLVGKAEGPRRNIRPCIEKIREFIQLKKNRLALQASNPLRSINSEGKSSEKSIVNDIFVADNVPEASATDPGTIIVSEEADKDNSEHKVISSILEAPHKVEGPSPIMQDTENAKEFSNILRKLITKDFIKSKPPSIIPKILGVLKSESKEMTECKDRKAGHHETIVSSALADSQDESFKEKGENDESITPQYYSPVKLVSSRAKHFKNKMKDSHKFKDAIERNILNPIKINVTNGEKTSQDKGKAHELDIASKSKRLQSSTPTVKEECVMNKKLETQINNLDDINATEKHETDPVSAASDIIPITEEIEPPKSVLVKDLIKRKLLRLAQKHMDKSVSTYPPIADGDYCKMAAILPLDNEESTVLEPEELLESVTLKSPSLAHTILKKRPSILSRSKPSISRAQEDIDCDVDNRSLNKLEDALQNSPSNSIPLKQSGPVVRFAPNFKAASETGRRKTLLYESKPLPGTDVALGNEGKGKGFNLKSISKLDHEVTSKVTDENSPTETSFSEKSVTEDKEVCAELKTSDDLMPVGSSDEPKIWTPQSLTNKSEVVITRDAKKSLDSIKKILKSKKKKKDILGLSKDTDKTENKLRELQPEPDDPSRNNDVSGLRESYAWPPKERCISPELGSELNENDLARMKSGKFILECRLTPKFSKDFR